MVLMFSLPWPTWERLIVWFAIGMVVFFGYGVYHSKLGSARTLGETSWSRALKVVGLVWMILGSLAAIIWMARYRKAASAVLPGASGWLVGCAGLAVSISIGTVLNLLAQVSDHVRARLDGPRE